jgi:hypothetical protein
LEVAKKVKTAKMSKMTNMAKNVFLTFTKNIVDENDQWIVAKDLNLVRLDRVGHGIQDASGFGQDEPGIDLLPTQFSIHLKKSV